MFDSVFLEHYTNFFFFFLLLLLFVNGVGNGNPIQYSCLENSMDRETWGATVREIAKSRTQLSTHTASR